MIKIGRATHSTWSLIKLGVAMTLGVWIASSFFRSEPTYGGKPLRFWISQTEAPKNGSLSQSIEAFQHIGPKAVPSLVKLLHRNDSSVRELCVQVISKLPARLGSLFPVVPLDSSSIRARAAAALGRMGPAGSAAVPHLVGALHDPDPSVRMASAYSLGELGGLDANLVVPALMAALNDPQSHVRQTACAALGSLGPNAWSAVPSLTAIVREANPELQTLAIIALGKIGPNAAPAVAELTKLAHHTNGALRSHVAQTLSEIGHEPNLKR